MNGGEEHAGRQGEGSEEGRQGQESKEPLGNRSRTQTFPP